MYNDVYNVMRYLPEEKGTLCGDLSGDLGVGCGGGGE